MSVESWLIRELIRIGEAESGEMYCGKPDRWWDDPRWRCANGHVSKWYVKSEEAGGGVCPNCGSTVYLTFPEDRDGPLHTPPRLPELGKEIVMVIPRRNPDGSYTDCVGNTIQPLPDIPRSHQIKRPRIGGTSEDLELLVHLANTQIRNAISMHGKTGDEYHELMERIGLRLQANMNEWQAQTGVAPLEIVEDDPPPAGGGR